MKTLFLMAKAVATSPGMVVLASILVAYAGIRWYCLVLRKLNSRRGV